VVILFQCAIGPVQDFIASARRSRDLWYGSWLLSELAKAAAKTLADQYQLDSLIFPSPQSVGDLEPASPFTVPNKVVALIDGDPDEVGAMIKTAIDSRLHSLWKDARGKIGGRIDDDLARRQLDDLVEFYWVSVPLIDDDYRRARGVAEAFLAARKSTRNFGQFEGDFVPKSSLDGSRESVIPADAYPKGSTDPRQDIKIQNLYRQYRARRGEQLSGVDLLKRMGQRGSAIEQKFKSTSHMAALPYLQMVRKQKGEKADQQLFDTIQTLLQEKGIDSEDKDGSLLYESRLQESIADESKLSAVRKELQNLLREFSGTTTEPGIYYALLLADGDNMGKAIDAQTSHGEHQRLSQALSAFAFEVGEIVEEYQGLPIFSGGDDVLAYLPVHKVLQCATRLADTFAKKMEKFSYTEDSTTKAPTLSVGIAVVHHLDPLSDALELARSAEKEAKKVKGKDALAITVSKRSGVDRTIVDSRKALSGRLEAMIGFLYAKKIGKGAAYELQELHRLLGASGLPTEAIAGEALRVLKRKRESQSDQSINQQVQDDFSRWMNVSRISVADLAQELIIAGVFADAQEMALGPMASEKEEIQ